MQGPSGRSRSATARDRQVEGETLAVGSARVAIMLLKVVVGLATRALVLAGAAAGLAGCDDLTSHPLASRVGEGGAGEILYLTYCQSCHGVAGRGDGAAAPSLRTPPTDLTQLWKRYGTPLDREPLAEYIDGRQLFGTHGPREMPIWGNEFFEDAPPTTPNLEGVKRRLIEVLVDHLETLQTERQI